MLIIITLPALLGAAWVGVLHHNAQRGLQAARWAVDPAEPAPERPVFILGTLAGGVLWVAFTALTGMEQAVVLLSEPTMWIIVLLPDLAWAAGCIVAVPLLPLRRLVSMNVYDASDAGPARQHAFE